MGRDDPKKEETIVRETFAKLFSKNIVRFDVSKSGYSNVNKRFRLALITEYEGEERELHSMLMSGDELIAIADTILEALKQSSR